MQGLCVTSAGPFRSTGVRSLYEDILCKMSVSRSPQQDPVGLLVQDLSVRMPASGSCRNTCARSLYADLLRKIPVSGSLHQGPVGPLVQDLCMRIS